MDSPLSPLANARSNRVPISDLIRRRLLSDISLRNLIISVDAKIRWETDERKRFALLLRIIAKLTLVARFLGNANGELKTAGLLLKLKGLLCGNVWLTKENIAFSVKRYGSEIFGTREIHFPLCRLPSFILVAFLSRA